MTIHQIPLRGRRLALSLSVLTILAAFVSMGGWWAYRGLTLRLELEGPPCAYEVGQTTSPDRLFSTRVVKEQPSIFEPGSRGCVLKITDGERSVPTPIRQRWSRTLDKVRWTDETRLEVVMRTWPRPSIAPLQYLTSRAVRRPTSERIYQCTLRAPLGPDFRAPTHGRRQITCEERR